MKCPECGSKAGFSLVHASLRPASGAVRVTDEGYKLPSRKDGTPQDEVVRCNRCYEHGPPEHFKQQEPKEPKEPKEPPVRLVLHEFWDNPKDLARVLELVIQRLLGGYTEGYNPRWTLESPKEES